MNGIELFGINWKNDSLNHRLININKLSNEQIGDFAITLECLQFHTSEFRKEDFYKIILLIREKTIYGKSYFIYYGKEYEAVSQLKLDEYTLIEYNEILNEFPQNIIELQTRSLMLLYKQFPKYGEKMSSIGMFDFFAGDYPEWAFILEAIKNKNWLNVKISKASNGGFAFLDDPSIAEEGWIEIEKNIEKNYSKQVFVAMWFDSTMNNAFNAIEKAVMECGLNVVRIDQKEHNNEISGEILFEIKKSKIIIADVTNQRNGVYFEAGFAMGNQKTVIWSCQESDLKNVHFDTRQYNHVLWKDENDLYKKLKSRLLATLVIET
jgi:hypothetical protein